MKVAARVDGQIYVVDGTCTHAYAELTDGGLDCRCLTSHDIRDGSVMEGLADGR
ncbi:Rieske (2Fe-2S) protein [Siminovitchia sediminis]|uniref:Rieske (2Fe-2S) protein n=1 Tax=Siminovitchia sediminis TaxID=1274353 RepID=A0ABW4KG43_9BACI